MDDKKRDSLVQNEAAIDVAGRVNEIRVDLGMLVSEFAERIGVNENTLRSFLKTNNPHLSHVYDLSERLGVSMPFLVSSLGADVDKMVHYIVDPETGRQRRPNVAARVKMILKKKGLVRARISERIGVSSNWWPPTLKKNNPSMRTLARIAFALDVDPVELVIPVTDDEYGEAMKPSIDDA